MFEKLKIQNPFMQPGIDAGKVLLIYLLWLGLNSFKLVGEINMAG